MELELPKPSRPVWRWTLLTAVIVSACAGPSSVSDPPGETGTTPGPTASAQNATTSSTTTIVTTTSVTAPSTFPQADGLLAPPVAGPSGDPGQPLVGDAEPVTVASITDGDTIRVSAEGSTDTPVRLIGINSPESGECYAEEAALALAALVPVGSSIGMTRDVSEVDDFGRLLRYLWLGGMSMNEEMVRRGVAISRRYPPDTAMAERLERAQADARESQLGLWAPDACGPRSDAVLNIVALEYDAPGDDSQNLNEEWIVIRNDGVSLVDLTGWGIKDESAGNRYRFPDTFTLAPGESVTVRSGCGDDFGTDLFWCSVGAAIWNNDGDTAFLLDPNGSTHATRSY